MFCALFLPPWNPNVNVADDGPEGEKNQFARCPRVNIEIEGRGETGRAQKLHYFCRGMAAATSNPPPSRPVTGAAWGTDDGDAG